MGPFNLMGFGNVRADHRSLKCRGVQSEGALSHKETCPPGFHGPCSAGESTEGRKGEPEYYKLDPRKRFCSLLTIDTCLVLRGGFLLHDKDFLSLFFFLPPSFLLSCSSSFLLLLLLPLLLLLLSPPPHLCHSLRGTFPLCLQP